MRAPSTEGEAAARRPRSRIRPAGCGANPAKRSQRSSNSLSIDSGLIGSLDHAARRGRFEYRYPALAQGDVDFEDAPGFAPQVQACRFARRRSPAHSEDALEETVQAAHGPDPFLIVARGQAGVP